MAQSLSMYEAHASSISRTRSCLVVEPAGLGGGGGGGGGGGLEMFSPTTRVDVSLPAQAAAIMACAEAAFPAATSPSSSSSSSSFVVAGFSLGGRIGMAIACLYPERIQYLHLTGVGWERSASGKIAVTAWKDLLFQDNLRGFAWSALTMSYSACFLLKHQNRLVEWVDTTVSSQTASGLLAILEQTHPVAASDPWSVPSMVERLRLQALDTTNASTNASILRGSLCIGVDDCMISVAACQQLAESLQWPGPVAVQDAGHAVPMEAPRVWRQHLLGALDTYCAATVVIDGR
jgi:pimeloyl-ACP methyl ester carboxylesterase